MTEKFEKMIEYQRLDMELRKMNREYNKHPDKKKLDVTRNKFNDAQSKLDSGSSEAETLAAEIERVYNDFKRTVEQIDALEKQFTEATDDDAKAKLLPQLESLKGRLESAKNKIGSRVERIKQLSSVCMQALNTKKSVKDEYDKIKVRLDEYRKSMLPDRENTEAKMKELEPTLDKELFAMYARYKNDGIAPVFVEVVGDSENSYSCRCGMQLSQTNKSELKSKKMCQCETCRRIVYLK